MIVFDTAPTGHTLRFLSFPSVLEKALGKLSQLSGRFGPMLQQVGAANSRQAQADIQMQSMFGGGAPQEDMFAKLEQMREVITEVNTQFKDPVRVPDDHADSRISPLSSACASPSSSRYTRPSASSRSSQSTKSTRTTL